MKLLPLSKGKFSQVDDAVYDALMSHGWKWHFNSNGYAVYTINYRVAVGNWRNTSIFLHRWILESFNNTSIGGLGVDHINGDSLDNRLENLRVADHKQNQWNCYKNKASTSMFKGVCWNKRSNKWKSQIQIKGKTKHLGLFDTEQEAAKAYDKAARQCFGEYARPNLRPLSELRDYLASIKLYDKTF